MTSPTTRTAAWSKRGMDTFINTPETAEQIAGDHNIGRPLRWLTAERAHPEQFMAAHRLAEEFVCTGSGPAPPNQHMLNPAAETAPKGQRGFEIVLHGQRHGFIQLLRGIQARAPQPISR